MKRNLFFMALSAMALVTSCSNDEVTEISDSNAIKFDVTAGNITRADNVYCNYNLPTAFKVWAQSSNNAYIQGDSIKHENNAWTDVTATRYWPKGNLDFYATVNSGDFTVSSRQLAEFTVNETVGQQLDLLYAVKKTQNKDADNGTVKLNFRHALSQIVFKAQNKNKGLYVEIDAVGVYNVKNAGTFTLPENSTDNNIQDHTSSSTTSISNQGSWNGEKGCAGYPVAFDKVTLEGNSDVLNLTDNTTTHIAGASYDYSKAMLLLPCASATEKWNGSTELSGFNTTDSSYDVDAITYTPTDAHGSFILAKCAIWNVADLESGKQDGDVLLYGNKDGENNITTRWIVIPASFKWAQGKKYIYTLVFNKGNGGKDPQGPDDVLVDIKYEVTVDDFIQGENKDVDMDEKGTQTDTPTPSGEETTE